MVKNIVLVIIAGLAIFNAFAMYCCCAINSNEM